MRRSSRRGAALLLAVVVLCTAALFGMATYLATVAVGAARVQHQRDTVQCVYAAESGIELAMARANRGDIPAQPVTGSVGTALFTTQVRRADGKLLMVSDGTQQRPGRADLVRRLQVQCQRSGGSYLVTDWQSVPPPETTAIEPAPISPQEENR